MPLAVLHKTPMPRANMLIRLTASDTKFLASRVNEAVARGTGVNLIIENLNAAICLIETAERGKQISLNAFTDHVSHRVSSPMKGYNGPWSHFEFVTEPQKAVEQLGVFLDGLKERLNEMEVEI